MEYLTRLSFCGHPYEPLSFALERWFDRGRQQVQIVSESELLFALPNTIAIEGRLPFEIIKIPIEKPISISRVKREYPMPGLGVYEDDLAEVKMDQVLVFRGSFEDAAKVVYELLMSNAKNHPDFHVEKAPLKTLASIIADATLPWEIVEAAKFLSEIIEPTSACVALEHTRDSYRFMFRDPLPVGRNTKAEGSFAVLRRPDGYYDASSFHKVQASEVFYCPHYRPLIRTVLNDLRELLRR